MKTGIFYNISNKDYHEGEGISKSGLDLIARSPLHYIEAKNSPRKETTDMLLGTVFHAAVLEPDVFNDRYVAAPEGIDRRTKAGREEYAAFELEVIEKGLTVVGKDVIETALAMRDALWRDGSAATLLYGLQGKTELMGRSEMSVYWEDKEVQEKACYWSEPCKCRPDFFNSDGIVVDLKSTTDARESEFARSVAKFRYYVQNAYYMDGLKAAGLCPREFVFIAVEKTPPYGVNVYILDNEAVSMGRDKYKANLETYFKCAKANKWPGYAQGIRVLGLPGWVE